VFSCVCKRCQAIRGRFVCFLGFCCRFRMFSWINQPSEHWIVRLSGYDIFTSGLPLEVDPILNLNTVCKNTPSLNKEQLELCKTHADVVASALQGAQMAVHECQQQFTYRRWNCSALETKNSNPLTSPLLARGEWPYHASQHQCDWYIYILSLPPFERLNTF